MQTVIAEAANVYRRGAIYSLENPKGNRSRHRTDILHQGVVYMLRATLGLDESTWSVQYELGVACTRATHSKPKKTFDIDIIFTNAFSGRKIYVLFKSIEKSHNKNAQNYANCKMGEIQRLFGTGEYHGDKLRVERKDDVLVFVTYLPERCLNGKSIEKVNGVKIEEENFHFLHDKVFDLTFNISTNDFAPNFESFVRSGIGQITNVSELEATLDTLKETLQGGNNC